MEAAGLSPLLLLWSTTNAKRPTVLLSASGLLNLFNCVNQLKSISIGNDSEQMLVDCDTTNAGCNGGMYVDAWTFLKTKGPMKDSAYPYVSGTTQTVRT